MREISFVPGHGQLVILPCANEARRLPHPAIKSNTAAEARIDILIEDASQCFGCVNGSTQRKIVSFARAESDQARIEGAIFEMVRPVHSASTRLNLRVPSPNCSLAICVGALLISMFGAAALTTIRATKAQAVEWRASL